MLLLLVPEPFGHPDSYSTPGQFQATLNQEQNHNTNYLCICMCDHCINCEWKRNSIAEEKIILHPSTIDVDEHHEIHGAKHGNRKEERIGGGITYIEFLY